MCDKDVPEKSKPGESYRGHRYEVAQEAIHTGKVSEVSIKTRLETEKRHIMRQLDLVDTALQNLTPETEKSIELARALNRLGILQL